MSVVGCFWSLCFLNFVIQFSNLINFFLITEPDDGKIRFRKPVKRSSDSTDLKVSSKKSKDAEKVKDIESKLKKSESKDRVKNSSLLSFGDDEDEDDDE